MQTQTPPAVLPRIKYIRPEDEFCQVLRDRVKAYFDENGINRFANRAMNTKTFVLLGALLLFYALMMSNWFKSWDLIIVQSLFYFTSFVVWVGIAHDAHHKAYTSNTRFNKFLIFIGDMMGVSSYVMDFNHVRAHHSAVNVPHHDVSIDSFGVMRFHPGVPYKKFHRFQAWYILPVYGIATMFKLLIFDFFTLFRSNIGALHIEKHPLKEIVYLIVTKSFVLFMTLVLPMLVLDAPDWLVLSGFVTGHFLSGVGLSMIFQVTHLCDYSRFTEPDESQRIHNAFPLHVVENTSSFSVHNKWITWISGGLNHHTIHHIFPGICQIHFPALTQILKATAKEYGVPYKEYPTMWDAVKSHFLMLHKLSKPGPYVPEPFTDYPLRGKYASYHSPAPIVAGNPLAHTQN